MGIKVLDCTLRDGAYVVDSFFGAETIEKIIYNLGCANVDIIECGWLKKSGFNLDSVLFSGTEELKDYFSLKKTKFALMFDYGKFDFDGLVNNSGIVDIIRVAFHKDSLEKIFFSVEQLDSKGYKVFLQPSNIIEYNEKELNRLCHLANSSGCEAVYIVDSYGSMFPEDLNRIMPVFESEVDAGISIGFHSHNNIQLSFGLTIQFINYMQKRNIILDSSLCGLGRGAGNTKTELLLEYLNRQGKKYNTDYIWQVIESDLCSLYKNYNWEYTPQRGLSGIKGLHPGN